jgi:hypothetical protein
MPYHPDGSSERFEPCALPEHGNLGRRSETLIVGYPKPSSQDGNEPHVNRASVTTSTTGRPGTL